MMLWNLGILSTGFFDTLLAEKVIHAGLVNFNTKDFWALNDLTADIAVWRCRRSTKPLLTSQLLSPRARFCTVASM